MDYTKIPQLIADICHQRSGFRERTELLFEKLKNLDRNEITAHVEYGGVIPESYPHDSSEEKLFAKYCDFLLARALTFLGMEASVIEERADAADVIANTKSYSLVGDAKAFRLSRTAKNQKDFKVEALDQWRKEAKHACLVSPLYQYPTKTSQIYAQAIRYKVTLLSFTHLGFMLKCGNIDKVELTKLWQVSGNLRASKDAVPYWNAISQQVCRAARRSMKDWDDYLAESRKKLLEQAQGQVVFWEREKERIRKMGRKEAVETLIEILRIDSNISMINHTIADLEELVREIS